MGKCTSGGRQTICIKIGKYFTILKNPLLSISFCQISIVQWTVLLYFLCYITVNLNYNNDNDKAELHTAAGISIRFPRVTKERQDKTWTTATSLEELRHLYNESKNNIDIKIETGDDEDESKSQSKKRKYSDKKTESPSKVNLQ